jgi:hypothetical protein
MISIWLAYVYDITPEEILSFILGSHSIASKAILQIWAIHARDIIAELFSTLLKFALAMIAAVVCHMTLLLAGATPAKPLILFKSFFSSPSKKNSTLSSGIFLTIFPLFY